MVLTTAMTLCSNISWDASHSSFCLYCHFGHVWNFWNFLDPFWQLLVEILWSVPNLPKNISFSEKFETFPKSKNNQNELWLPSCGVLLHMEVLWWLMECSGSQEVQHLWKKTEKNFSPKYSTLSTKFIKTLRVYCFRHLGNKIALIVYVRVKNEVTITPISQFFVGNVGKRGIRFARDQILNIDYWCSAALMYFRFYQIIFAT